MLSVLRLANAALLLCGLALAATGTVLWLRGPAEDEVWGWTLPAAGSTMAYVAIRLNGVLRRVEAKRPKRRGFEVRVKQ